MKRAVAFCSILVAIGLMGCDSFLTTPDPTATSFDEFFNDEGDLRRVVYSSYLDVFTNPGNRRTLFYMREGRSDNAYSRLEGDHHQLIGNGSFSPSTRAMEYYYSLRMKHTGRLNTFIANADVPYVEDEATRDKYTNILKALRIWHYFYMTFHWGDVPFIREPVDLAEARVEETPQEVILDTLFTNGLKIAEALPSEQYTSDKYMFNEYSLKALLMRYALYFERYELAADLAKEIMDSGQYSLHPDYGALFQYDAASNNNEFIIWMGSQSFGGRETWTFNHLGPHYKTGNGDSYLVPLKSLVDSYWTLQGHTIENSPRHTKKEYMVNPDLNRDPRFYATIMGNGDVFSGDTINVYDPNSTFYYEKPRASASGYWFKKWVSEADAFRSGGNMEFGLLRYAEVLLTYAEAKIMMNQVDALAKTSINKVRERAGLDMTEADVTLPRYSGYTQQQWTNLIRRERRVEFAGEGLRYADIIRWGIAEEVLNEPARGDTRVVDGQMKSIFLETRSFAPRNYLWPFHASTMKINPHLTQNPGY